MTYANGRTRVEKKDGFGRLIEQTDLGGHLTSFAYDTGGRLASVALAIWGDLWRARNSRKTK